MFLSTEIHDGGIFGKDRVEPHVEESFLEDGQDMIRLNLLFFNLSHELGESAFRAGFCRFFIIDPFLERRQAASALSNTVGQFL